MIFAPDSFTGKSVVVTGGSSGIGMACAVMLSHLGARLAVIGRNSATLDEARSQMAGGGHVTRVCDLSAAIDRQLLRGIADEIGPLSGLVCAAGMQIMTPLRSIDFDATKLMFQTNVHSSLELAMQFRDRAVRRDAAGIVFISSVMGLVGQPAQTAYGAGKAALLGATKCLALELAREGIRVNAVAPGIVETPMSDRLLGGLPEDRLQQVRAMHALGFGRPDDVASAVTFLLSDAARWITGTTLVVDGGYTAH